MLRTHKLQTFFNRLLALALLTLVVALPAHAQDDCRLSLRPCMCVTPAPGMVAWWTGDNTAEDLVGGNHGTLHNGVGYSSKGGKVGAAFVFDEDDDYVSAPAQGVPTGNAPRTVEAWVYTEPGSWARNTHTIFEYGVGVNRQAFGLDMDNYPFIQFYTWDDDLLVYTGAPEEGWMHVAATYDGTTLRVYVNGVERAQRDYPNGINTVPSDISIGRSAALGGASYLGRIDEASIYDHALTDAEIASIYRADSGGKCRYAVSGRITDDCGVALEGAAVTAQSARGTLTRSTTTDAQGNYAFSGLPGGASYVITPQAPAGLRGSFAPSFSAFDILSANQTADFFFRPFRRATSIPCLSRFDFVSDLDWVGTPINAYQEVHRDRSVGDYTGHPGNPITLNGIVYNKGLGVHANSEVIYNLGGEYSSFISDIGLDDELTANGGSVKFFVYADGRPLYSSGLMVSDSPTQTINVNVRGVYELKLVVTDAENGNISDHGDWANARLLR